MFPTIYTSSPKFHHFYNPQFSTAVPIVRPMTQSLHWENSKILKAVGPHHPPEPVGPRWNEKFILPEPSSLFFSFIPQLLQLQFYSSSILPSLPLKKPTKTHQKTQGAKEKEKRTDFDVDAVLE